MRAATAVAELELDLPALAAAFGRRLHAAGVPVTAERSARFAEALALTRPVARRAAVLDRARRAGVGRGPAEGVRRGVPRGVRGARVHGRRGVPDAGTAAAPPDDRAPGRGRPGAEGAPGGGLAAAARAPMSRASWPIPVAASDEERLRGKRFDALEPGELAQLYALMTPAAHRGARAAHAPRPARPPGRADRPAPHAARQPAHRRRPDPPRPPPPPRHPPADRAAVRHQRLDGALRPRLPAVPDLRGGRRAECRGVRVRHPPHAHHARARHPQPRAGDPARRRRRARLVERHADRRCAEGVQRPSRPPRHGPRCGDRDPVATAGSAASPSWWAARWRGCRGSPIASSGSTRA